MNFFYLFISIVLHYFLFQSILLKLAFHDSSKDAKNIIQFNYSLVKINNPKSIRDAPEKLHVTYFKKLTPPK